MVSGLVIVLCLVGVSISHEISDDHELPHYYGFPTSATLTGTSSKLAPGAEHYVSAPPLPYYNGYGYRPLPQYLPSWSPFSHGFHRPHFNWYGHSPPNYGFHHGYPYHHHGYPYHHHGYPHHHHSHSQSASRSGRVYAGRDNYGSGFIEATPHGGYQPAQYSQHIQQVANYIPIANQLSLAYDEPVSPYEGTHFTKADQYNKLAMDLVPPTLGTAHLPQIYQTDKHGRRRRSLNAAKTGGYGSPYHPYWDTYYQRLSGYNPKLGYGNYNPYVFDYQTPASLDNPLLTAHYPSDYYGYSMHQLPSLRPSNPFSSQPPGLALNPHYQYSRAAYRNFLHQSMDGVDPVEYVKQLVP